MREPTIQEQFARIRSCNKLLFGVCTVKANSLVFASGLISVDESKYYIANGAVGVIAGRFYDIDGNWLRGTMDDRMIGITLDDVRSVPTPHCRRRRSGQDRRHSRRPARRLRYRADHRRTDRPQHSRPSLG